MNEIASPINNEGNEQKTQPLFRRKLIENIFLFEKNSSLLNPEFFTQNFFISLCCFECFVFVRSFNSLLF